MILNKSPLPELKYPGPKITPGFTITLGTPSCIPRHTSFSAAYFVSAYTFFISSDLQGVSSQILWGSKPSVATELT